MIETSFKKIFQEKDYIIMGGNNKEALQRENTIRFIEAAEELIDEHGIDNVSVIITELLPEFWSISVRIKN